MIKLLALLVFLIHSLAIGIDFQGGFGDKHPLLVKNLTQEDFDNYHNFEHLFNQLKDENELNLIPKKLHFIWLGPYQPPKLYQENILSWIDKHPDWQIYLWTDRPIESFHPKLEHRFFQSQQCLDLESCFLQTLNYSERATIASYVLLKQFGGAYVDCDVECFQAIDPLISKCDFFCPIDFCPTSCLSSCINAGKHVIGSTSQHPIIDNTIRRLKKNWMTYTQLFQGQGKEPDFYRLKYRSLLPFSEAVMDFQNITAQSVALPPLYFTTIGAKKGLYGHHYQMHTVESTKATIEQHLSHKINKLIKKNRSLYTIILLCLSGLALAQLLVTGKLFLNVVRIKR